MPIYNIWQMYTVCTTRYDDYACDTCLFLCAPPIISPPFALKRCCQHYCFSSPKNEHASQIETYALLPPLNLSIRRSGC